MLHFFFLLFLKSIRRRRQKSFERNIVAKIAVFFSFLLCLVHNHLLHHLLIAYPYTVCAKNATEIHVIFRSIFDSVREGGVSAFISLLFVIGFYNDEYFTFFDTQRKRTLIDFE